MTKLKDNFFILIDLNILNFLWHWSKCYHY